MASKLSKDLKKIMQVINDIDQSEKLVNSDSNHNTEDNT